MTYQINSNLRMVLANMDDYDDGFDPMLLFFHNGKLLDIKGVIPGIVDVEILEHPVIDGYTVTLIHGDGLRQDNNLIYGDLEEVADYILSLIPSTTPETHTGAQEAPTEPSVPSPDVQSSADPEPRPAVSTPVSVHIRELASNIAKLCETAIKKVDNGNSAKRAGDNEKSIRYYQAAGQKMNSAIEDLYELVDADLLDGLKAAAESSFKNNVAAYLGYLCGEFLKIAKSYLPSPDSGSASMEPACEFDDGEDPGYQYFDYLFCHILLCGDVSLQFQSRDDLLDFVRSHPGIKLSSFPAAVYRYVAHEQAGHIKNICLAIPYCGRIRPLYCLHDDHVRQTLDFVRNIGHIIRPAGPGEVPPPDIPRSHDFIDVTSEFLKS